MDVKLFCGDCFDVLKDIPEKSIDLVLIDPPYNIQVENKKNKKKIKHDWDKIEDYSGFCKRWISESHRVLKDNGSFYFWHNDIKSIADLLKTAEESGFAFNSFCIWEKENLHAQCWKAPGEKNSLRCWFNICEFCVEFFKISKSSKTWARSTGTEMINSNPESYRELKEWYKEEKQRLNLTDEALQKAYTEKTGKKPNMFRHYFCDTQFELPTRSVWETVFIPLGFNKSYEDLRRSYEDLRHYHALDLNHCNVWRRRGLPSANRFHICQKPTDLLERIIKTSCRPGGIVLDFFMGSGSTGVAAVNCERNFIGVELDRGYFEIAEKRIHEAQETPIQLTF